MVAHVVPLRGVRSAGQRAVVAIDLERAGLLDLDLADAAELPDTVNVPSVSFTRSSQYACCGIGSGSFDVKYTSAFESGSDPFARTPCRAS